MKPISKETKYILTTTELAELVTQTMMEKGLLEQGDTLNFNWQVKDVSDDIYDRYPDYQFHKLEITVKAL